VLTTTRALGWAPRSVVSEGGVGGNPPMKVAVLWKFWNDYLGASLNQLVRTPGVDVLLCEIPRTKQPDPVMQLDDAIEHRQLIEGDVSIEARLEQFEPDLLLVCGWNVQVYRMLARRWRGRAVRVLYMDNQWLGTTRQLASLVVSPLYLWPCFDGVLVTGERQADFARKLGFRTARIHTGGIVADTRKFRGQPTHRGFLFVGRLVPEKGIDVLVEAYRCYRTQHEDPWPLVVCGEGPEAYRLAGVDGLINLGYVESSALPSVMSGAACLVLPSRFEPFGVVVHEAASMGLHVIATEAVGAADVFVEDFVNGRVVTSVSSTLVAEAMNWLHDLTPAARAEGSRRSRELAARQSPDTWAAALLSLHSRFDLSHRFIMRAPIR
jgi:glycosyltransferase involved in cell wall biosynthesis